MCCVTDPISNTCILCTFSGKPRVCGFERKATLDKLTRALHLDVNVKGGHGTVRSDRGVYCT